MLRLCQKFLCLMVCLLLLVPPLSLSTAATMDGCDHQYETVTTPPTCTQEGFVDVICRSCGEGYGYSIPATKHQYRDGRCTLCGAVSSVTLSGSILGTGKATLVLSGRNTVETQTTVYDHYTFTTEPGQYTLTVYIANHVPREYGVSLVEQDLTLDVKLCLPGDIDGNGHINMGDLAKLYSHLKGNVLITDHYQLQCANVSGEGLSIGDVAILYAGIQSTMPQY